MSRKGKIIPSFIPYQFLAPYPIPKWNGVYGNPNIKWIMKKIKEILSSKTWWEPKTVIFLPLKSIYTLSTDYISLCLITVASSEEPFLLTIICFCRIYPLLLKNRILKETAKKSSKFPNINYIHLIYIDE